MIAAIYARKSNDQPDAISVTRQVEHAKAFATTKGWSIDDRCVFVDDGISGAEFGTRPGYLRLLNALKPKPTFQVLIVSELSRLGREQLETGMALKQLSQAGVKIFTYLEAKEISLDTPTDKFLMSAVSFGAELEREKARQRTADAMVRKARAGHVTGGRVFGYENLRVDGHVERRILEAEAAVVRRIFELCAAGVGKIRIAKRLNAEAAPAPRSQQGRPRAWCASTVLAILYRDLYRGQIVYNRTRKRDTWGRKHQTDRPEHDWITVDAPDLRIVDEARWTEAHARLSQSRAAYLRHTNGQVWGRPVSGIEGKHLLTGLARCGCCGSALEVRTRSHGTHRAYYYGCRAHWRSGASICANDLEIPMDTADAAVLEAIEDDLLDAGLLTDIVTAAIAEMTLPEGEAAARRVALRADLTTLEAELARLSGAIAAGGAIDVLLTAVKDRDARRRVIQRQLDLLDHQTTPIDRVALETRIRVILADWRGLLRGRVPQARQIVSKLLHGRLSIVPERGQGVRGFRLTGTGDLMKFFGEIPEISAQAVASPTGTAKGLEPPIQRDCCVNCRKRA